MRKFRCRSTFLQIWKFQRIVSCNFQVFRNLRDPAAHAAVACATTRADKFERFLKETNIFTNFQVDGETPLMHAARAGRYDLCEALLFAGASASSAGNVSENEEISRLLRKWSLRKVTDSPPARKWASPELAALPVSR